MGIIRQQTVRATTMIFAGIGIGMVSRLLMPFILTTDQIGVLALLDSVSGLFATIFALGFFQVAMRMFPMYRDERTGNGGFLVLGILYTVTGIILGAITFHFTRSLIFGRSEHTELLSAFIRLILPMIFCRILFMNMDAYLKMKFDTVIGRTLESLVMKAVVLISLLLFWGGMVDYEHLVYLYVSAFCLPGLAMLVIALRRTAFITLPLQPLRNPAERQAMFNYSTFGILAAASSAIVLSIDQVMMASMLTVSDVGVYSILFFAGVLVSVPNRGLKNSSTPVLAEAWTKGDRRTVLDVYRKSSLNGLLAGAYLFIVGWSCLDDALTFLPDYQHASYVFFFIGLGHLVNMTTGVNTEIIGTSSAFRMNTYFTVALGILVMITNYLFIPRWGVVGAAIASCVAMVAINFFRWWFLARRFQLQPFNTTVLKALLIATPFTLFSIVDPIDLDPLPNIALQFTIITLAYWWIVVRSGISPDINSFLGNIKRRYHL